MKKQLPEHNNLEIVKAAAQAWLAHSSNPQLARKEFDMHKGSFIRRPSRFQLEAMKLAKQQESRWDFACSLWDPYEIVAVSKRLEVGLALDHTAAVPFASRVDSGRSSKRRRESCNSLRKLFWRSSSKRIDSG